MDICLRVLKESNKSRFDSYSVRNSVLLICHITFRDCRVHIFSDNLSRNSCIYVVARSLLSNCGVPIYKRIHGTERNKTVQLEENFGGFVVPRF